MPLLTEIIPEATTVSQLDKKRRLEELERQRLLNVPFRLLVTPAIPATPPITSSVFKVDRDIKVQAPQTDVILKRLYPEIYTGDVNRLEKSMSGNVTKEITRYATEDWDGFVADLFKRQPTDGEVTELFKASGLNLQSSQAVNRMFAEARLTDEEEEKIFNRVFSGMSKADVMQASNENLEEVIAAVQEQGRNADTEMVLVAMGLSEAVDDIFPQATEAPAATQAPTTRPAPDTKETYKNKKAWQDITNSFKVSAKVAGKQTAEYFESVLPLAVIGDPAVMPQDEYENTLKDLENLWNNPPTDPKDTLYKLYSTNPKLYYETIARDIKNLKATHEQQQQGMIVTQAIRDTAVKNFAKREEQFKQWVKANPEMVEVDDVWEAGVFKGNPDLLLDPAWYAYVIAKNAPITAAAAGVGLATSAITGSPALGMLSSFAVMTPSQSTDVYAALTKAGATPEDAAKLAVPVGVVIGALESVGELPLLKHVSPALTQMFIREATEELAKKTMIQVAKKGIANFTEVELTEVATELLQQVVQNAAVRVYDKTQSLTEGLPQTALETAISVLPFGGAAGTSSVIENKVVSDELNRTREQIQAKINTMVTEERGGSKGEKPIQTETKTWYRGLLTEKATTNTGEYYSASQDVAKEYSAPAKVGGKPGEVKTINTKDITGKFYETSNKETLAEELGIKIDPFKQVESFDKAVIAELSKQGYNGVHYQSGTFEAEELHVFPISQAPVSPVEATETAETVEVSGEQAVAAETPPVEIPEISNVPPTIPPQPPTEIKEDNSIVPSEQPEKQIDTIAKYSREQFKQNPPRELTKLLYKLPGLKQVYNLWRPGLQAIGNEQAENLYVAMIAEGQASYNVATWTISSRLLMFNRIKKLFGKEVVTGGKADVEFVGTAEQKKNPITYTFKDIAENPDLYKLSTAQRKLITDLNDRNSKLLEFVNTGYDAEIGEFQPKEGAAYLPNMEDLEAEANQYLGKESKSLRVKSSKERVWQTARERMSGKTPFTPELNIVKLLESMDSFKSSVAGAQSFRQVLGGKTKLEAMQETHPELYNKMTGLRKRLQSLRGTAGRLDTKLDNVIETFLNSPHNDNDLSNLAGNLEVEIETGKNKGKDITDIQTEIASVRAEIRALKPYWEAANLKPYEFVQDGIFRYFPADVAGMVKEARKQSTNKILAFMDRWRAGAFSGDTSPFAIQGLIGVLADPIGSLKAGYGALQSASKRNDFLYAVKLDALAEDIATDPESWSRYASLVGRKLSGTPKEYAAGFMSKIPGFDKFTEGTFITVTRGSYDLWKRTTEQLKKGGMDKTIAEVIAAKDTTEVYPLFNPTLLGQSPKMAAFFRSMPTSISFILKPATLIQDGMAGLTKSLTLGKVKATPQERLAMRRLITISASVLAVSATSAYLSAKAAGKDDDEALQAMLDAINPDPNNGKFASVIIGNLRIPLGGPYRAIFRALYPKKIEGVPFPVPGAGLYDYFKNRINPAISTQIELFRNKDYFGNEIRKGNVPEAILRGILYEFENVLPLTLGSVVEKIRTEENDQIVQEAISQFVGVNVVDMDNTYFNKKIRQLGLPDPDFVPDPNKLNVAPIYDTKDLWGDTAQYIKDRELTDLKFLPKLTQEIAKTIPVYDKVQTIFNQRLIDLDPETYSDMFISGNLTPTQNVLLRQYYDLDTAAQKTAFLKKHPEMKVNPREKYLTENPKENAQLAVWGKANILTPEAYKEAVKIVEQLGLPDNAVYVYPYLPPPELADAYFLYKTEEAKPDNTGAAVLKKYPELAKWLGKKITTTGTSQPTTPTGSSDTFQKIYDQLGIK